MNDPMILTFQPRDGDSSLAFDDVALVVTALQDTYSAVFDALNSNRPDAPAVCLNLVASPEPGSIRIKLTPTPRVRGFSRKQFLRSSAADPTSVPPTQAHQPPPPRNKPPLTDWIQAYSSAATATVAVLAFLGGAAIQLSHHIEREDREALEIAKNLSKDRQQKPSRKVIAACEALRDAAKRSGCESVTIEYREFGPIELAVSSNTSPATGMSLDEILPDGWRPELEGVPHPMRVADSDLMRVDYRGKNHVVDLATSPRGERILILRDESAEPAAGEFTGTFSAVDDPERVTRLSGATRLEDISVILLFRGVRNAESSTKKLFQSKD